MELIPKQNVNYIVLMHDRESGRTTWARCEDMSEVERFKWFFADDCPNAGYEVYKVSEKVS